jgi:hypothetical protein
MNQDCVFLFYDVHDLWHFTSALALVVFCLMLYHVDDDLRDVKASEIVSTWVSIEDLPQGVTFELNEKDVDHDPIERPIELEGGGPTELTRSSDPVSDRETESERILSPDVINRASASTSKQERISEPLNSDDEKDGPLPQQLPS